METTNAGVFIFPITTEEKQLTENENTFVFFIFQRNNPAPST